MNWHTSGDFSPLMLVLADREAYKIRTLYDAARVLLSMWPDEDGEHYVIAVKACLDAINREIEPEMARAALIKAAEEANITVITIVR